MERPATYSEVVELLRGYPSASPSWAESIVVANLSMSVAVTFLETMTKDVESPLRAAEEGIMKEEVRRLNIARGSGLVKNYNHVKYIVSVRNVLSAVEKTRVMRSVSGFCQPTFDAKAKFGTSGHAVMNAVRRVTNAYITSRIPEMSTVIEVGPDVKNWLFSSDTTRWVKREKKEYVGARPIMGARDVLRVSWEPLVKRILRHREDFFTRTTIEKAELLDGFYSELFPETIVQKSGLRGEYIVSYDSNYDVAFSDMPLTMAMSGARVWYGVMTRAKGLTSASRLDRGSLDLLGVNYRVDWKSGRIDFRHPECSAFGYSHNVWEYMKYEARNGNVWTTADCHYVYNKGPETTDELLFFSVVRVPKAIYLKEPRFVENPQEGKLKLSSIWSVGGEVSGVPTAFVPVEFFVDSLNFSKVLEKRRALDHKGSLAITVSLIRSTNVRFWINGTPVGANVRIEARLAEATAVVVETLVAERRLEANVLFERAMFQFKKNNQKHGWLLSHLAGVMDMKAISGDIAGPIMRVWNGIRTVVIDKALSSVSDIKVGFEQVDAHLSGDTGDDEVLDVRVERGTASECRCMEIAEARGAMALANGEDADDLRRYIRSLEKTSRRGCCSVDLEQSDEIQKKTSVDVSDSGYETGVDSEPLPGSDYEDDDVEIVEELTGWRADENLLKCESRSMREFVELEEYLHKAKFSEIRMNAYRLREAGRVDERSLRDHSSARVVHGYIEVRGERIVARMGADFGDFSAVYDHIQDKMVMVGKRTSGLTLAVADGWYYTCDTLAVWNYEPIINAGNYALDYGKVRNMRRCYDVTLGVPGAGKTYRMMKRLWKEWSEKEFPFYVLAATRASAAAAKKMGMEFGFPSKVVEERCMTVDKYLMHKKTPVGVVCIDEFVAMHIGKVDVVAAISGAMDVRLYGDAEQIYYDPFCAEFVMRNATLGDSVALEKVTFLPETHRLGEKMCAIWLDRYPSIYPCECCDHDGRKKNMEIQCVRKNDIDGLVDDGVVRFHAFRQAEKEELKSRLGMSGSMQALRARIVGGLATTHEDQGSTHDSVVTVRLFAEYDKNASARNPSLYNRLNYVLSDMTRAKYSYTYWTLCPERDEVCKRIELAEDQERLGLVRQKKGMELVSVADMLR